MRNNDAARFLRDARDTDALIALARALGFGQPPLAPPRSTARMLGLAPARETRLIAGTGRLRAVTMVADDEEPMRDRVQRVARSIAHASPSPLWLLIIASQARREVAIATWSGDSARFRVSALLVDQARVVESDAETVCALAAAMATTDGDGADVLMHARWLDVLGREALSRRFYRRLEHTVRTLGGTAHGRADVAVRDELALLATSRLLFLTFLESKGWLAGDRAFLRHRFDACMASGGGFHDRVLRALFFGTLNTPASRRAPLARAFGAVPFLNGGLFSPTASERRHRALTFDDAALGTVIGDLLGRFRFTARETSAEISEAAVDPEMLGRAFESLMAAPTRRATGAFYTPHAIVARMTDDALRHALARDCADDAAIDALLRGHALDDDARTALRGRLASLRVLDPACGSGAFLVQVLERLASLRAQAGETRPIADIRRDVLATSIFGVDVNPTAVWLCELRLWLSVVIETPCIDPRAVPPLPNLDRNVRVGDALAAAPSAHAWGGDPWSGATRGADARAVALRRRYVAASGARKATLARALDRVERTAAVAALDRALAILRARRAELLAAARGRDLFGARRGSTPREHVALNEVRDEVRAVAARKRAVASGGALPFGFAWHFAELAAQGANAIIGNPPWVRPHALDARERDALRAAYATCRNADWRTGATLARAGRGFAAQVDLAAPFVERSLALVRDGGAVALLVPAKLWRTLAGGGLRRLLAQHARVHTVVDWSDAPPIFDAATYPSQLVATRGGAHGRTRVEVHRGEHVVPACVDRLSFDDDPASPWLLVPRDVRDALDALRSSGAPLGRLPAAQLLLGAKCGCNDAFLVRVTHADADACDALIPVEGRLPDGSRRRGHIERGMLRPVLRGEHLQSGDDDARIVWPHDARGAGLRALPPHTAAWLAPWRTRLLARRDLRSSQAWWTIFRTAAARCDRPRVVWADVARSMRPIVLPAGDPRIPLNSCYALRCDSDLDARALAALLASNVAAGWFTAIGEPARGGFRRHLAWTVALLPVPHDWARARELLAPNDADERAVGDAYGLAADVLAPLADWAHAR